MDLNITKRAFHICAVLALDEVRKYGSREMLPEHIVLGILKDSKCTAYRCLVNLGIDMDNMEKEIRKSLRQENATIQFDKIKASSRVYTLLDKAYEEAKNLEEERIGTEHFILAAANESTSPTAQYLKTVGASVIDLQHLVNKATMNRGNKRKTVEKPEKEAAFQTIDNWDKNSLLDRYTKDLTEMAQQDALDPVVGRNKEINRVMRILARRTKNNPVLIGQPGVGKSAVVEGLAQLIASNNVPEIFFGKKILSFDLTALVAGTRYRGEFEERMKKIMDILTHSSNIILFIDEIHTIVGAGGAEGTLDVSNILKPVLSRGQLQCIGATTMDEYKKYIEKDAALERRFQPVIIEEPDKEEAILILQGLKARYEDFHGITYENDALKGAVELSSRYIPERHLPDKAIDVLDEAGSHKRMQAKEYPEIIDKLESRIEQLIEKRDSMVESQDYENAAQIRDRIKATKKRIEFIIEKWKPSFNGHRESVTLDDIRNIISETTGIPMTRLMKDESEKLLNLETELHKHVIGQEEAIAAIASSIRRSRTGISSPDRPLGSFIFTGPTGVGKTFLAKKLSEYLFGDVHALIRIDMSDFMEKFSISRLVGAPPGYVGYTDGGLLTEKIRKKPYAVILLDEIEKAHIDIFNLLLQILEEGELQDNLGHKVSFRNTILIMTSNIGAQELNKSGFGFSTGNPADISRKNKTTAMAELKKMFRPEFLNRVDEIISFHNLEREHSMQILDLMLNDVKKRLAEFDIQIDINEKAKDLLLEKGFDSVYGARPLRRTIQKEMEDPLSFGIIKGRFKAGNTISVETRTGSIHFRRRTMKTES